LTDIQTKQVRTITVPPSVISDQDLVKMTIEGNKNAYGGLMRRYNQRMFRVARSIVKNDSVAMDIVQESHIKAFSSLGSYSGSSSLAAWLYAITRNEALMYLRKHKVERTMITYDDRPSEAAEAGGSKNLHLVASADAPDRTVENEQLKNLINLTVDKLPEDFRIVFVLRAIEQLSVKETAEILEINSDTVKTRYFRAKRLMRKNIQNHLNVAGVTVYEFGGEHCDKVVHEVMSRIRSGAPLGTI